MTANGKSTKSQSYNLRSQLTVFDTIICISYIVCWLYGRLQNKLHNLLTLRCSEYNSDAVIHLLLFSLSNGLEINKEKVLSFICSN
jgi:hypothetical protein